MSGPNTITIQVDNSGALTAIAGTAEAVKALGTAAQQTATQMQALTGANSATASATANARDAATGMTSAAGGSMEVLSDTLELAGAVVGAVEALDKAFKLAASSSVSDLSLIHI